KAPRSRKRSAAHVSLSSYQIVKKPMKKTSSFQQTQNRGFGLLRLQGEPLRSQARNHLIEPRSRLYWNHRVSGAAVAVARPRRPVWCLYSRGGPRPSTPENQISSPSCISSIYPQGPVNNHLNSKAEIADFCGFHPPQPLQAVFCDAASAQENGGEPQPKRTNHLADAPPGRDADAGPETGL
ncbi:hypothetical protein, partial [Breoghania corrubedonensis]|uniref:hypothetical protein n=1 Tax=Breoghania corrubedonensis TaxID=665038 RepID=UPI001AECC34C